MIIILPDSPVSSKWWLRKDEDLDQVFPTRSFHANEQTSRSTCCVLLIVCTSAVYYQKRGGVATHLDGESLRGV